MQNTCILKNKEPVSNYLFARLKNFSNKTFTFYHSLSHGPPLINLPNRLQSLTEKILKSLSTYFIPFYKFNGIQKVRE